MYNYQSLVKSDKDDIRSSPVPAPGELDQDAEDADSHCALRGWRGDHTHSVL